LYVNRSSVREMLKDIINVKDKNLLLFGVDLWESRNSRNYPVFFFGCDMKTSLQGRRERQGERERERERERLREGGREELCVCTRIIASRVSRIANSWLELHQTVVLGTLHNKRNREQRTENKNFNLSEIMYCEIHSFW